jgi:glycosyltransferase involved in cell wall biosynthesis
MSAMRHLSQVSGATLLTLDRLVRSPGGSKGALEKLSQRAAKRVKLLLNPEPLLPHGDRLVIGGWGELHRSLVDTLHLRGIRPSVLWCSTLGQAEMTKAEIPYLADVLEYLGEGKIRWLLLNRRNHDAFGHIKGCVRVPHAIALSSVQADSPRELEGLNVDLFFPWRPGKNLLAQISAVALTGLEVTAHVNVKHEALARAARALHPGVAFHEWLPEDEYWNLISGMDLSLQVTHTESFNYAVCERMCLGIPVLTTYNIYLASGDEVLRDRLCCDAPDTPSRIAEKMAPILSDSKLREDLGARCRERIGAVARENNREAAETLNDLFG